MAFDATPSCLKCPSMLAPTQVAEKFGKSIGAPVCARFGRVLERPNATNAQNQATMKELARSCGAYGEPMPRRVTDTPNTVVALFEIEARDELSELDGARTIVKNCVQCKNFIPETSVFEATGWAAGACRAKGILIPSNRRLPEANGCQYRKAGAQHNEMNLQLLPIYTNVEMADEVTLARAEDSRIEPLDYPTDREVSPEEMEIGIQAWRKVEDPEGTGNFVMLPVFDPKSFTEEERKLIPQTGDDEHPESYFDHNGAVYRIATLWMELDETPAVWGQPGVGKTEIGRHLAWLMQMPFQRFSIKPSTELYELEGVEKFHPEKGTYFRDGRFTKAWSSRCVMTVDEPNLGRTEVWAFLRPCMDNSKQLILDSDGGRNVDRNGFAFLQLAMNPAWSPLNVGAAPIGAADASRLMHIEFGLPEEAVERKIIQNRVRLDGWEIDTVRLNLVMSVSEKVRELCADGTLSMSWGIRENIKVSRAMQWFDPLTAYKMAAADYLEPSQRDALLDQVRGSTPADRLPAINRLGH